MMRSNKVVQSVALIAIMVLSVSHADTMNIMSVIGLNGLKSVNISDMHGKMESLVHDSLSAEIGSSAVAGIPYKAHQDHQYIFIANPTTNSIAVYRPQLDGSLLDLNIDVSTGKSPNFLAVDEKGSHLYATNGDDDTVSVYCIDSTTGALISNGTVKTGGHPSSISVIKGKAIVTNYESNTISVYNVDPSSGMLSLISTTTVGARPILSNITKDAKYIQVLNEGNNGASTMSQFALPETGSTLVALQPAQIALAANTQSMLMDGTGKYLYTSNKRSDYKDAINVFEITLSGTLVLVQSMVADISLLGDPSTIKRSLSIDPREKILYLANAEQDTISSYTIESTTGKISPIAVSIQNIKDPVGVAPVNTMGSPDSINITESNDSWVQSAQVELDHVLNTPDGDPAKFTFIVKNPNSNSYEGFSTRVCVEEHKYFDQEYMCYSDTNPSNDGLGALAVLAKDGSIYTFFITNMCTYSAGLGVSQHDNNCSISVDVYPGTSTGSSASVNFYIEASGIYDEVLYGYRSQTATVDTDDDDFYDN